MCATTYCQKCLNKRRGLELYWVYERQEDSPKIFDNISLEYTDIAKDPHATSQSTAHDIKRVYFNSINWNQVVLIKDS